MARKLPQPITKEQFDKLLVKAKEYRDVYAKTYYKKKTGGFSARGERIEEYMITMILQFYTGMRVSEILGLKPEVSLCCHAHFDKKKVERKTIKICTKCFKEWSVDKYTRGHTMDEWQIEPLSRDNIQVDRIFISQGKGKKDRWVWRPKLLNQKAIGKLPLKIGRRAYAKFLSNLSTEILGRHITTHLLRHSFAIHFLNKKPGELRPLQILMGHSRLDTTAGYLNMAVDDVLKKVEEVF